MGRRPASLDDAAIADGGRTFPGVDGKTGGFGGGVGDVLHV